MAIVLGLWILECEDIIRRRCVNTSKLALFATGKTLLGLSILRESETRWAGSGVYQSPTGDTTFVYSSKPEGVNRVSGVGLIISNKAYEALLNWQPVYDRIISARFSSKVRNITIIQCYAPTELADDNEKDEF